MVTLATRRADRSALLCCPGADEIGERHGTVLGLLDDHEVGTPAVALSIHDSRLAHCVRGVGGAVEGARPSITDCCGMVRLTWSGKILPRSFVPTMLNAAGPSAPGHLPSALPRLRLRRRPRWRGHARSRRGAWSVASLVGGRPRRGYAGKRGPASGAISRSATQRANSSSTSPDAAERFSSHHALMVWS